MKWTGSIVVLGAWFAPLSALSATAPPAADAAAPTPPVSYRSAFEHYRPFREEAIADWRTLNEEVGRAGGHIGIMGGAAGHAGHGGAGAKPPAGMTEGGQPPVRGAPQAPVQGGQKPQAAPAGAHAH